MKHFKSEKKSSVDGLAFATLLLALLGMTLVLAIDVAQIEATPAHSNQARP